MRQRLSQYPLRWPSPTTSATRSPNGGRVGKLGHAIAEHPRAFTEKPHHSMDWYYPILGGALRGSAAGARIAERWHEFVVDGLGIRCVNDRPWVTGAETCEFVMALDAIGGTRARPEPVHRDAAPAGADGSYWTGLVFADGKRWPVERTTGPVRPSSAADTLSATTGGSGIFRGAELPAPRGRLRLHECVRN